MLRGSDCVGGDAHARKVGGDATDERLTEDSESRHFTTSTSKNNVDIRALGVGDVGEVRKEETEEHGAG
ncbi:hypothetical protein PI125_g3868 [Phytophthora idaei]|nr:hypothetical protein PI125_g3868 [Phytophthora idaei]